MFAQRVLSNRHATYVPYVLYYPIEGFQPRINRLGRIFEKPDASGFLIRVHPRNPWFTIFEILWCMIKPVLLVRAVMTEEMLIYF